MGMFYNKKGFGIVEVLISAAVLGFLYLALLNMQGGNRDALLRIRGRDAAVEVAQQVIDSLKRIGPAALPSNETKVTTIDTLPKISREWERGSGFGGGKAVVMYTPEITVMPTQDFYVSKTASNYDPNLKHVFAKQVNVKVSWQFKGSTQSINVSGVIR